MLSASKKPHAILAAVVLVSCTVAADADRVPDARAARQVTVTNGFGSTLVRFYATSTGSTVWGADRLGDAVVPRGHETTIAVGGRPAYCLFDFRAEFANGSVVEDTHQNLCETAEISYF